MDDGEDDAYYIVTRGKANKLQVVDPGTLEFICQRDTQNFSVFSIHKFNNLLLTGCFDGHLFVFDIANDFERKESKQITQGVYDFLEFTHTDQQRYLLLAQHFGNMEVLNSTLGLEWKFKHEKINTIFKVI